MLARLGIGLMKGLILGAAVGAGIFFGLHWPTPAGGALGYLLAIGTTGTTGIFAGRAPWKDGAWIEAALKGLVGAGVGGGLYWLAMRYGGLLGDVPTLGVPWVGFGPAYLALIAGVFGAVVELDHAGDEAKDGKPSSGTKSTAKVRVADEDDGEAPRSAASTRADRKR